MLIPAPVANTSSYSWRASRAGCRAAAVVTLGRIRPRLEGRPTVLLADDHTIVTEGLRFFLEPDFEVVGAVRDGRALVEAAARLRPDIIIVEVSLPLLSGIEAVREIKTDSPNVKIIFLTGCSEAACAAQAMAAGGSAVVPKTSSAAALIMAVQEALQGGTCIARQFSQPIVEFLQREAAEPAAPGLLSSREMQVLRLIAQGLSAKQAAYELSVSPRTVEFHRYRITGKLGIRSTAELTQYAMKHGVVPA